MTRIRIAAAAELRGLPEIWEPKSPALAAIFAEIPVAVGAPGVHLVWRLLANFPDWLIERWPALSAALSSPELRRFALAIQRAAFIQEAVGLPSHKAFRGDLARAEIDAELREKIENFNALSQLALARLLVAMAVARRLPPGRHIDTELAAQPRAEPVSGPPGVYVPPLRDDEARGKAVEVLARVSAEHGLPVIDDYLRSLARIPDYLGAAWNAISPLVGDPEYLARAAYLSELAADAAVNILVARGADPPAPPGGRPNPITALLGALDERLLPQALIDVTLIRALTSGPEHAVDEQVGESR